ncbi:FUSC family protein, partial [Bordetella avium]|uniref:FUSC family protein n=1 Tax=Bordetella avium TaxID=521 RepID=UPI003BF7B300
MNSAESWSGFLRLARHDLIDPFPGRFAQAWRIALTCALTTMMAAVYGIPEAALSCYLIFFVMKPDAAEGVILAVALTILVAVVVLVLFMLTRWTIDVPALRILAIAVTSIGLLYLGSASKLGELGGIIALVLAFVLTLLDMVPFGEAATRAILYAWLMATMPMACVLAVNLTLGRKPLALLRHTLDVRLRACADLAAQDTPQHRARLLELVGDGQEASIKRLGMTRLLALGRRNELRRVARALQESYRIATALQVLPPDTPQAQRDELATQMRQAAEALARGQAAPAPAPAASGLNETARHIHAALRELSGTPDHYPTPAPGQPFMRADARRNPEHLRYAIKTTAAAILCYLIYTAAQWQGIHTAMITCYVAALGSVAETTHKLVLRITGCLIGAALGIGSIVFLMPHMTSVGAIMVLVFIGTLLSAWVAVGSERISYAGVQIALAFLLTVLQGFGPTFDMDTARDRVVGVLLGNFVLYVMFTQFWPVGVLHKVWDSLQQSLSYLSRVAAPGNTAEARDLRLAYASKVADSLAQTRQALGVAHFEVYRHRPSDADIAQINAICNTMDTASLQLLISPPADARAAERLDALARAVAAKAPDGAPALTPSAKNHEKISL